MLSALARTRTALALVLAAASIAACSDDDPGGSSADVSVDASSDASVGDTSEDVATDTEEDADDASADADPDASDTALDVAVDATPDATPDVTPDVIPDGGEDSGGDVAPDVGPVECQVVRIDGDWDVDYADDVSIAFRAALEPSPTGFQDELVLLFERYTPGPDVGVWDLSTEPDNNFGTCAHCVFVRGPNAALALFAESGTLETLDDPYQRTLNATGTSLRLIEVEVDGETRTSTPIPGGHCIEIVDFSAQGRFPAPGWTCDPSQYNDGASCECTCGTYDPDCDPDYGACFPLDPLCEPEPAHPISDCEPDEVCGTDVEARAPTCQEACDWLERDPCDEGVCAASFGATDADVCFTGDAQVADVELDEFCGDTTYQQVCAVDDAGFAMGFCDYEGMCASICDSDDDCLTEGDTCQWFIGPEGLGFCGTFPEDED